MPPPPTVCTYICKYCLRMPFSRARRGTLHNASKQARTHERTHTHLAIANHVDEATLADVAPADERCLRQHRLLWHGRHAYRTLVWVGGKARREGRHGGNSCFQIATTHNTSSESKRPQNSSAYKIRGRGRGGYLEESPEGARDITSRLAGARRRQQKRPGSP